MFNIARLNLVDYFSRLISDIDLKAEKEISLEIEADVADSSKNLFLVEFINKKRLLFIDEITKVEQANLKNLNELKLDAAVADLNQSEQFNEMIFSSFCFLMNKSSHSIGQLFIIDKYISDKKLECFKELSNSFVPNGQKLKYENCLFNLQPEVKKRLK
jgi:hypothetical protein